MEMEFMEEFAAAVVSGDRARQIVRGKRTKRQRPCSPIGTAAVATSSTSSGGGGGGGGGGGNSTAGDGDCVVNYYAPEMSTEEEEDMANCLIMLAQSVCPVRSDHPRQKTDRLSSRRFTEVSAAAGAAAAGGGKSGFYVYECKTCNRTFPSFQALGGHRASHKKPKLNFEEKRSVSVNCPPPLTEYPDERQLKHVMEDREEHKSSSMNINNHVQKSPSPSPGFIQSTINNNNKGKVHECSICGSEFLSGQALGGHMRKHRTTPPSTNRIGTSTSINDDRNSDHITEKSPAGGMLLSLDLNLPPPEVADDVQSKFQFTASTSQQHLVFSASALVDCHY